MVSPCSEFRIMKQTNKSRSVRDPHAFILQIILSIHNEAVARDLMIDISPVRRFTALERLPVSKAAAAMLSAVVGSNGLCRGLLQRAAAENAVRERGHYRWQRA